MSKCPLFGICGGCKYDFSAPDYHAKKSETLPKIENMDAPIWGAPHTRRRADFAAAPGYFGFYKNQSHDIINITNCPNLVNDINNILPHIAKLPWGVDASVLITKCENGIVVNVSSRVPYFSPEFRESVQKLPHEIIRFTWGDKIVRATATPQIAFDDKIVDFPDNSFLQPSQSTEKIMRDLVVESVRPARRVADLFCGIGNFSYATHATGFDITGPFQNRDLFNHPIGAKQLNQYDAVIMDPPRAGALAQSREIAKSSVARVVYVSCNPATWMRDARILTGAGYKITRIIPIDQFVGATHWEIFSVFEKNI